MDLVVRDLDLAVLKEGDEVVEREGAQRDVIERPRVAEVQAGYGHDGIDDREHHEGPAGADGGLDEEQQGHPQAEEEDVGGSARVRAPGIMSTLTVAIAKSSAAGRPGWDSASAKSAGTATSTVVR